MQLRHETKRQRLCKIHQELETPDALTTSVACKTSNMETPRHYRPVVAVDLDHTLAKVLESALEWHNKGKGTSVRPLISSPFACFQSIACDWLYSCVLLLVYAAPS